jgi:hypothetical protein
MAGKNISVVRCFEDAEYTGILELCGRNLKEFPEHPEECELIDVFECGWYFSFFISIFSNVD